MSQRSYLEISEEILAARDVRDAEAMLRCAIELDELGTTQAQALASRTRGSVAFLRDNNTDMALELFQRALKLFEDIDDSMGIAKTLQNIAEVYDDLDRFSDALEYYHRALELFNEVGDQRDVARIKRRLGIVMKNTGHNAEAYSLFHQALESFQALGLMRDTAFVLNNIGLVHKNSGRYPEALELLTQSLSMFEELKDQSGVALLTRNIGGVYYLINDYATAIRYQEQALAIYESIDDQRSMASALSSIGNIHIVQNNLELGLNYYRQSLAIMEKSGAQRDIAHHTGLVLGALVRMGLSTEVDQLLAKMDTMQITEVSDRIYREASRAQVQELRGLFDDAKATLLAALQIAQEHKIPFDEVGLHGQLRDLALKQGDLASYVEHNNAYQRINEEINGKETTTRLAIQEADRRIALERQEHQKHLAILHSTLPQHIADRVARGEVVNDHHDNAAVIFLDIAGFTVISDQLTSTEVVQLLDTVFTALDTVCKKHDVVKIKTIGDSYMAVAFPSAVPHSVRNDSAVTSFVSEEREVVERAANAALDMLHAIADLPESLRETLPSGLQVRIGLHVGAVTAGVIGTERMQYDVWGDTVNVASRMESTGEPGRIHVSSSFALALNGEMAKERKGETDVIPSDSEVPFPIPYSLFPRGEIEVKGKGLMTTYWLEG